SEMLSSDASASIEINPVHHCTPYDQQLPVSPYPCKGLHPEVRAKRASKDAGHGAEACILRGSALRAEHLRMRASMRSGWYYFSAACQFGSAGGSCGAKPKARSKRLA